MKKELAQSVIGLNIDIIFKVKKLLVGAIFDNMYLEFFLERLRNYAPDNRMTKTLDFSFNDADKSVMFTLNTDSMMDIRYSLAKVFIDISNSGIMCDVLYLMDQDAYFLFKNNLVVDNPNKDPNLFTALDLSFMFNINYLGGNRYVLSLIQ